MDVLDRQSHHTTLVYLAILPECDNTHTCVTEQPIIIGVKLGGLRRLYDVGFRSKALGLDYQLREPKR